MDDHVAMPMPGKLRLCELQLSALAGLPEIRAGDDLAAIIGDALARDGRRPAAQDILVIAQKIVSKAEGRSVRLADVIPSGAANELAARTGRDPRLVQLVLDESEEVLRATDKALIVRHRLGLVMANAGIDRSNVGGDRDVALLLPLDPDASAAGLRAALEARFGTALGVIISDSFGRAWRVGSVNVAIGAAGLPSIVDRRGESDRDGRRLEATEVALADAVAAAAGLLMGEADEGLPAILVRGVSWERPPSSANALIRPLSQDLFP